MNLTLPSDVSIIDVNSVASFDGKEAEPRHSADELQLPVSAESTPEEIPNGAGDRIGVICVIGVYDSNETFGDEDADADTDTDPHG